MGDSVQSSWLRRIACGLPWGLAGMVVLIAMVEMFVARRKMAFLDMDDWAYRRTRQVATREARRYDLLCFGDSLVKLGVVPRAIEERTGWRTYNLAISGSQAPASYFLLRRVLASGAKPRAVVVDFHPPLLGVGPRHNRSRWASLLSWGEAAELCWSARDADLFGVVVLGQWFPSFRCRSSIRDSVMAALAGRDPGRQWLNFLSLRQWSKNAGAQLMPTSASMRTVTDAEVENLRNMFYADFSCHPANAAGVERFLALAAAHDVPVYWLLPPLLPAVHARLAKSGFDARHEAFIRTWQERFPNLVVIDGRGTVSAAGGFWDANHLSAEGAYGFSLSLAVALRQTQTRTSTGLPAARWVRLPASRNTPIPEGVEDIDRSRLALEAMKPRR
jgi:hypothetical protein